MRAILVIVFYLMIAEVSAAEAFLPLEDFLAQAHCQKQIKELLHDWKSSEEYRVEQQNGNKIIQVKTPTKTIGKWIFLHKNEMTSEIEASLISPRTHLQISLEPKKCSAKIRKLVAVEDKPFRKKVPDQMESFDDFYLTEILSQERPGLIYALSANMHFSLEGTANVIALAKELKLDLHLVCDPDSCHLLPEKWKKEIESKTGSKVKIKSLSAAELFLRGFGHHYPTLIAYNRHGKLSGIYPGLKSPQEYKTFIGDFL